jgi:hypothetical protein
MITVDSELGRMWKEKFVAYFELLPEEPEEYHEETSVRPRFKPDTSRI